MSKVLIAKLVKPISGYQSDKDKIAESGMEIGTEVKVDKVSMEPTYNMYELEDEIKHRMIKGGYR